MKRFLYATVFALLTLALFWAWMTQQRIEAYVPVIMLSALPLLIGAGIGLMIAGAPTLKRGIGLAMVLTYLGAGSAFVGKSYFSNTIVPACQLEVEKTYHKSPDTEILKTWCMDEERLKMALVWSQNENDRESFDWILSHGFTHPHPDCARLGIAVASYDLPETHRWLDNGLDPSCKTRRNGGTPLDKLFSVQRFDPEKQIPVLNALLDAGAEITQDHMLFAIRAGNQPLLAESLKFVDPNFGFDHVSSSYQEYYIRNPLAMAVHKLNVEALETLIDAGAVPSRRVAVSFERRESVEKYSLHGYAQRLKSSIDHDVNKYARVPRLQKYLPRELKKQASIDAIVALLELTDPFIADAKRQREEQLARQQAAEEERRKARRIKQEEQQLAAKKWWWRQFAEAPLILQGLNVKELEYFYDDKPRSVDKLRHSRGLLRNFHRDDSEYRIYSEPSSTSRLLYYKRAGSLEIYDAEDSLLCSFEIPLRQPGSCFDYFSVSGFEKGDLTALGGFTEYRFDKKAGEEWFRVKLFDKQVWINQPFVKNATGTLDKSHWRIFPGRDIYTGVLQVPDGTRLIKDLDSFQPTAAFDRVENQILFDDLTIYWIGGKPYIKVTVANNLTPKYSFCGQKTRPAPLYDAYLEMIDATGKFQIGYVKWIKDSSPCH